MAKRREPDERRPPDRRSRQPLLYTPDQLVGRSPVRLRRAADKRRLIGHLCAVAALLALSGWWVVPLHAFAGPVLLNLSHAHGIHVGDLPVVLFLAAAARSLIAAGRLFSFTPGHAGRAVN